uniref:ADP,ATP carrier protein n=2 Tax=Alexandrium monilatum TaxID=311494 RepID=A0A7S4Q0J2_9DINO
MRAEGWLSFLLVFRMMASIQESEGTWALWRGLGSSLWLTCVPVAQFCLYEGLRALDIWGRGVDHRPSGTEAFLLGAVAKGGAAIATYPLQVVQSNLRLRGQAFGGTLAALMRLRCERGFAGLFAGFEAKILQTALNGALMMLTYEKLLDGVAFLRT